MMILARAAIITGSDWNQFFTWTRDSARPGHRITAASAGSDLRSALRTRCSRAAGFSHVVRYGRTSALGSVVTPSRLDAASHGPAGRWVLLVRSAR